MPSLLLALLAVSATALALGALAGLWRRIPKRPQDSSPGVRRIAYPALLATTLCLYALVLPAVGFVPATLAFTCLWAFLIGRQEMGVPTVGSTVLWFVEAFAITAAVYVVFALVHQGAPSLMQLGGRSENPRPHGGADEQRIEEEAHARAVSMSFTVQ